MSFVCAPAAASQGVIAAASVIANEKKENDISLYLPTDEREFIKYVHHIFQLDDKERARALDIPKTTKVCVGSKKEVKKWMESPTDDSCIEKSDLMRSVDGHFVVGVIQQSSFRWITTADTYDESQSRALRVTNIDENKNFTLRPVASLDPRNARALLDFSGWGSLKAAEGVMIWVAGDLEGIDERVIFWKEDGYRTYDMDNYIIKKTMAILDRGVCRRNEIVVEEVKLPTIEISRKDKRDFAEIKSDVWMGHTNYYIHAIQQIAKFSMDRTGGKSTSKTMVIIDKELPDEKVVSFDFTTITFGFAHIRALPLDGEKHSYVILSAGIRKV